MIKTLPFALVVLLASQQDCPPPNPPTPGPTSTPVAHSPLCSGPGQHSCWTEVAAGDWRYVCSTPWLPGGVTNVSDPSKCPVPPGPSEYCVKPGGTYELIQDGPAPISLDYQVSKALAEVAGTGTICDGSCKSSASTYQADIDKLISKFPCAGRQVAGAPEFAIRMDDSTEWTYQPYEMGGFKCMCPPSKSEPATHWRPVSAPPTPQPTPTPTPAATCPPVTRIDLKVAYYAQRSIDTTPKVEGLELCTSLGFTDRRECPLGVDGDPRRPICEAASGPYTCTAPSGAACDKFNDNPLQFAAASSGTYKVCAATGACGSITL